MDGPSEQKITINSKLPNEKLKAASSLTGQELDAWEVAVKRRPVNHGRAPKETITFEYGLAV